MINRHNKKPTTVFRCGVVAILTLIASASVRAESCQNSFACLLGGGPLEVTSFIGFSLVFTAAAPFVSSSDATNDGLSRHYVQGVKDDAAAYLATDGELDGPLLESAWRKHLEQHAGAQPSKNEFAKMVLANYG